MKRIAIAAALAAMISTAAAGPATCDGLMREARIAAWMSRYAAQSYVALRKEGAHEAATRAMARHVQARNRAISLTKSARHACQKD